MDDGRPHGPATTDSSSASKPDLALQSPAAWSLSPGGPPLFQSERKRFEKRSDFFKIFLLKSWSPPVPPRSFSCDVARLSRKTRSYLIYSAGPLHIRCPASAAAADSRTLFPVRRRSSAAERSELGRVPLHDNRFALRLQVGNFFISGPTLRVHVGRDQHQNNWSDTSHLHPPLCGARVANLRLGDLRGVAVREFLAQQWGGVNCGYYSNYRS